MSQKQMILEALQRGERLTSLDALERFGCFRLPARICELKADGHNIPKPDMIDVGNGKRVAEYRIANGQLAF